jgi:hypothetical protein
MKDHALEMGSRSAVPDIRYRVPVTYNHLGAVYRKSSLGEPMKVFISHASEDRDLARRVRASLRAAGLQVRDEPEVLPGDNWGERLAQVLQDSDAMVILLTPNSLQAPNVSYELAYALGKQEFKGRVVPVLAAPPEQLPRDRIPWVLNKFQTVSLSEADQAEDIKKIAAVLQQAA